MILSRRLSALVLLAAFVAPALAAAGEDGPPAASLAVEVTSDEDYGRLPLPSRILGVGLKNDAYFRDKKARKDPNASKFNQISFEPFNTKVHGTKAIHGVTLPFFFELAPEKPGEDRDGFLFYGPAAWKLSAYWKHALKNWEKGQDVQKQFNKQIKGFLDKEHKPPKALLPEGLKLKRGLSLSIGDLKRLSEKGSHYEYPQNIGDYAQHRYWDSVFARPGEYIEVEPAPEWAIAGQAPKGTPEILLAVVYPDPETYLTTYFRNCTALKVQGPPPEIIFFDDNLNGAYGEPGTDSVMVGSGLAPVGEHLSVKGRLFRMKLQNQDGERTLDLWPVREAGRVRLIWRNDAGADLQVAVIKSGKSTFSLVNPPEEVANPGDVKHGAVAVPPGTYEIVGGLVHKEEDDVDYYASFTGGGPIEVAAGEETVITLGGEIRAPLDFVIDGEKRIFEFAYPVGAAGEVYRWFSPRTPEPRLVVKGTAEAAIGEKRKLMERVEGKRIHMRASIDYDSIRFAPEMGPFKATVEFDPQVFRARRFETVFPRLDIKAEEQKDEAAAAE